MAPKYISRGLEPVLKKAARQFPAVVLTGPRQSGKTTLLQHLFAKTHAYLSLELPDVRASAAADARGFLDLHAPPIIFDEIQHASGLLPYIKERIDSARSRVGQYLLTGSQNLLLLEQVTESLAGRVAILRLLPLSRREIAGDPLRPLPWEARRRAAPAVVPGLTEIWTAALVGGYPEIAAQPGRDIALWHSSYIQTYLERDVRGIRQIGDLTLFQGFLRMLAARCGSLLSLSDVARDLGVAVNTVKAWTSVLEATSQIIILRPYFANVGKRLVKRPKVYFADSGTLCHLAGLKDPQHAAAGPLGGAILETAVLTEIVKVYRQRGQDPPVYFWRTSTGEEVDIVVQTEEELIPVEVKLSATPRPEMAAGIAALRRALGATVGDGFVVHPGDIRLPLGGGTTALPLAQV